MIHIVNTRVISLAVGAGVLIVVAALAVPGVRGTIGDFFTYLSAPREVKDMLFLVGSEDDAILAQVRLGALRFTKIDGLSFREATRHEEVVYAILEERASGEMDVYALEGSGELLALTRDGMEKEGLSVSPDGTKLAYAIVSGPLDDRDAIYYDVRRHSVRALDLATGASDTFGNGAHPYFLDNDTLFYMTEEGYRVMSISGGDGSRFADGSANLIIAPPEVDRDTGHFAFRHPVNTQNIIILHIDSRVPLALSATRVITPPSGTPQDFALQDGVAYYSARTDGETRIFRAPVEGENAGEELFTIPQALQIMSITF